MELFSKLKNIMGFMADIYGAVERKREARRQEKELRRLQGKNDDAYRRSYNENPLQRDDNRNVMNEAVKSVKEAIDSADAKRMVTGGTDAATAVMSGKGVEAISDAASRIAASEGERKDSLRREYQKRDDELARRLSAVKGKTGSPMGEIAVSGFSRLGSWMDDASKIESQKEDKEIKREERDYRRSRDLQRDEEKRRDWNYGLRRDWLSDFYRRNKIYMETGKKMPRHYDDILKRFYSGKDLY